MAKVTPITIGNIGGNPTSAANNINTNSTRFQSAIENTLSRDGSGPNQMEADFDLNHNDLLNGGIISADSVEIGGVDIFDRVEEIATEIATEVAEEAAAEFLEHAVIERGNVPSPLASDMGKTLRVTANGFYGWKGQQKDSVNVLHILGQSNAQGARNGGPNPASPLVKCWDKVTNTWGSSDYTQLPWTQSNPNGNSGNNNVGLAFAHRWAEETGRPTYVIFYFVGGTSIDHWVADGNPNGNGDYMAAWQAATTAAYASSELAGKLTLTPANHAIIWAQGEEDFTMDFTTYLTKFTTVNSTIRTFLGIPHLRIFVDGMSGLHDRYAPDKALQHYCGYVNADTKYVNSKGLQTEFDATGAGDYTHWLGPELYEFGYNRVWSAWNNAEVSAKLTPNLFWARGTGQATHDSGQMIFAGHALVSWNSRNRASAAVNTLSASTDSIAWGEQCNSDGNWTYTFGYTNVTDNLSNYTMLVGREITSGANGDYGFSAGYQNNLNHAYSAVFGRNNTTLADNSFIAGSFGEFISAATDSVVFQFGVGTSSAARKTALAAKASGAVRTGAVYTNATLPSAANAGAYFEVIDSDLNGPVISTGTEWVSSSRFTWTTIAASGQTTIDLTTIPPTATEVCVMVVGLSGSSTQTFGLQIGDAAGLAVSNYTQSTSGLDRWAISGGVAANSYTMKITIVRGPGTDYFMEMSGTNPSGSLAAAGHCPLAANLTRVRLLLSAAGTFDAGTVYIGWR